MKHSDTQDVTIAYERHGLPRQQRLELVHDSHLRIIQPLLDAVFTGFRCMNMDADSHQCHPVIASYCADWPEVNDMVGITHGNCTPMPCPRCTVPSSELPNNTASPPRTLESETCHRDEFTRLGQLSRTYFKKGHRLRSRDMSTDADNILSSRSLSAFRMSAGFAIPLRSCSFVRPIRIYGIMHFEPMLNLHLGITNYLLLLCLLDRIRQCYIWFFQTTTDMGGQINRLKHCVALFSILNLKRLLCSRITNYLPLVLSNITSWIIWLRILRSSEALISQMPVCLSTRTSISKSSTRALLDVCTVQWTRPFGVLGREILFFSGASLLQCSCFRYACAFGEGRIISSSTVAWAYAKYCSLERYHGNSKDSSDHVCNGSRRRTKLLQSAGVTSPIYPFQQLHFALPVQFYLPI